MLSATPPGHYILAPLLRSMQLPTLRKFMLPSIWHAFQEVARHESVFSRVVVHALCGILLMDPRIQMLMMCLSDAKRLLPSPCCRAAMRLWGQQARLLLPVDLA